MFKFYFIILALFLPLASFAQDAGNSQNDSDNFFEKLYPKVPNYRAMLIRDKIFGCGYEDEKTIPIDCKNPDTIIATKLIIETGRMDGFLRQCGSDDWLTYFGRETYRIGPIFKSISDEEKSLTSGMMHGLIQGSELQNVADNNLCAQIPAGVDKNDWLRLQAVLFFNSRLLPIESELSFPNPPYPQEVLDQIEKLEKEQRNKSGN